MNKEVIIAIVVGLAFGLIAALTILFAPQLFAKLYPKNKNTVQEEIKKSKPQEPAPEVEAELTIEEPEDRLVTNKTPVKLKGVTKPSDKIVVLSLTDEAVVAADDRGEFTVEIDLAEGRNDIQVVAYGKGREPEVKELVVYYGKNI